MASDWGTGLYGAPKIAEQMRTIGGFELLMHLGDVYYSGTEDEVQERFLNVWPTTAGKRTVAVNSNHEMYSGGFGYYALALPAIGQKSSYLAFENAHWLLVVLDTAYVDHDMDNEQVAWLNLVIKQSTAANGGKAKKLVLFSHQQLFSRLGKQGPKLDAALRHLLDAKAIKAWYLGPRASVRDLRRASALRLAGPVPRERRYSRTTETRSDRRADRTERRQRDVEAVRRDERQSILSRARRPEP